MNAALETGFFLVLLMSMGCTGGTGFMGFYGEFSKILQRNGASNENPLPPTPEQLNGLDTELSAYKISVEKQASSADRQAILKLMETELDLVHMQQNLLLAEQQNRWANLAFPSCAKESNLAAALAFFENASTHAVLAGKNLESFQKQFPVQSKQSGISFENVQNGLAVTQQTIQQNQTNVKNFCP